LLGKESTRGIADAKPAFTIFDRYLLRLQERNQFAAKVLKEKFDFTTDDSILANRHKAEWPKDEADAEALWRGRIKYELLTARHGGDAHDYSRGFDGWNGSQADLDYAR